MKKTFTIFTLITLAFTLSTVALGQKNARNRRAERMGKAAVQNQTQGQRVAVVPFQNKADNQWWYHGGAEAAQDVFVTELRSSGKFRVVEREQLQARLKQNNLTLSGDVDPSTAVKVGKLLGVNYLLTGAVTEYGNTDVSGAGGNRKRGANQRQRNLGLGVKTKLIDTSTGEIVWADEVRAQQPGLGVSVGGFGGGVDDERVYNRAMKDCARQVGNKLSAVDLSQPKQTSRQK